MELAEQRYQHWCAQKTLDPELRQELAAMQNDADKITDAFYRDLEFGTAGLRGVLGAGTNRMNIYVIRRATQAVADYLNETDLPKTVAIGHDSRIKSDVFAREAAAVFAANGITAYLYPRLEPVPALSFAVRHLHCGLGICVTASHNPAAYNGYKVYGSDGCQMTPEAAKRVVALLEQMDYFTAARTEDFDAALAAGRIRYIPDEVLDAFVDAVYAQRVGSGDGIADLKLVYTPLNGAGLECVRKLTQKLGIRNMTIVKEQEQPDGHFPTCPYPNPEIRQAMELGLQYCDLRQRDGRHPAGFHLPQPHRQRHDAGKPRRRHDDRLDRHGHGRRQQIRRGTAPRADGLQVYRRADQMDGAGWERPLCIRSGRVLRLSGRHPCKR